MISFLLGKYVGVERETHMVNLYKTLLQNFQTAFQSG